jgi:hypothetical protein
MTVFIFIMATIPKSSSILHSVSGIVQLLAVIGGGVLSLFPGIGTVNLSGGLTIVALVAGIKHILVPVLERIDSSAS